MTFMALFLFQALTRGVKNMDMYPKYKSPLGYSTGDNKIDAYGVDHSDFSTRDELEYQFARQNKENQLIQNYNNQGITKNYPQYTTNFWGSSPDNNYGFGTSKIHNNIENMQNQTNFGNSNNTQWGMNNEQSQVYNPLGNSNSTFNSGLNNSSLFSPNNMQGLNLNASAALSPQQNSFSTYSQPYQLAQNSLPNSGSDVGNITNIPEAQKQSTGFGSNQPVQNKPVYENPNPKRYSMGEILGDGVKGFTSTVINGATYPSTTLGELVADVVIAKDYYDQMNETGKKLVNIYGSGQAANIDNYYHPLLQCQLAKISPDSQRNGILLGYAKEGWDYFKKIFNNQSHQSIIEDSKKDLQNNLLGSTLGQNNPDKSCLELLDYLRTPNMRKQNIW